MYAEGHDGTREVIVTHVIRLEAKTQPSQSLQRKVN